MIKNDDDINWNSDIVETKNIKNNSKFIENKIPVLDKMCKIVCIKFQSSGNSDILCKIKKKILELFLDWKLEEFWYKIK